MSVHATARIMDQAGASQVYTSAVVPQLVDTEHFHFTPQGERELKGVPGTWQLYRVVE